MVSNETVIKILNAREARAKRHKKLLEIYQGTLLALTLNIPGPRKNTPISVEAFEAGLEAVERLFSSRRVNVLRHESSVTDDGPQACWIVDTPPFQLKDWMVELEEMHPLGRLYDLDVTGKDGTTIHREHMGMALRSCLLCSDSAHACARSRKHTMAELEEAIDLIMKKYLEEK